MWPVPVTMFVAFARARVTHRQAAWLVNQFSQAHEMKSILVFQHTEHEYGKILSTYFYRLLLWLYVYFTEHFNFIF